MEAAVKEDLLVGAEQARGAQNAVFLSIADSRVAGKGPAACARCGRKLTNPHSIARNLGPVCYRAAGGGAFDKDMQASEARWERRAEDLCKGGEWDFGMWDWVSKPKEPGDLPFVLHHALRVSVRFQDGKFEAYGYVCSSLNIPEEEREVVFYRGDDIRACWAAAIAAGPESNAAAYRAEREITRAWKAQWKARVRGGGRRG